MEVLWWILSIVCVAALLLYLSATSDGGYSGGNG